MKQVTFILVTLIISPTLFCDAQTKATLSGYIKDASNGEALIGATIFVKELASGASTNVYGFYSLTLPQGNYSIEISYIGFQKNQRTIDLTKDIRLDIELQVTAEQLTEVVVSAEREENNKVQTLEMSTSKLDIKTITKMPAFLGEADVVKSLLSQPGVSTVGEGSSGFNVRGGNVGQNLLLLDEAPVYNSSHMLGFFSAFNPDAVKEVKLYKGGIPARYGGRLSSLLDIRMKEGNNKEFAAQGGIGTIFSRLAIEAPIVKGKGSFLVAGRRSYIDVLAAPFLDNITLNFYDLTAKANYNINDKNRVYLSGYLGRDNFEFDADQGPSWGSQTGTLRWNHIFNSKLFANFTGVYSKYDYELNFGDPGNDRFVWNSKILNYIFKPEFSYFINGNSEVSFGGEATRYIFAPGSTSGVNNGEPFENPARDRNALEAVLFVSNTLKVNDVVSIDYGLRYSNFRLIGSGEAYTFYDTVPGTRKRLRAVTQYKQGETIQDYSNWEPRFSSRFQLNEQSSVKASYNRTVQYVHLISNQVASNPLDIWYPSTNNIKPQVGDQFALGYFRNIADETWEASVEGYYRKTKNQVDYINGADLLLNKYLEADLLSGDGRAYGLEFYIQRKTGRLNGWLSYTLSRTELKIEGINNFNWYPSLFDRTHNVTLATFYEINKRWSVSSNFTYSTGVPTTSPTEKSYSYGLGMVVPYISDNARNNYRLEDYHRLDIAFRLEGKLLRKNGESRKNKDYWVFSLYNVYSRGNAFTVDFVQNSQRVVAGDVVQTEAVRSSLLGSVIPSVSYNFKF
jgi:CarboxypepD_reg-like domain/TonB-dependent Receptor Plug Domain